jgi:DNA helicase-2/ATP-dependent DNA helicase PcrA
MNLVRHDLGFSKMEKRFPMKATCLAIYSRAVNAEAPLNEVLGGSFPWCIEWESELRQLFAAYVEAKQQQNVLDYDDLLLYWAQMMAEGSMRTICRRASIMSWSMNTRTPTAFRLRSC